MIAIRKDLFSERVEALNTLLLDWVTYMDAVQRKAAAEARIEEQKAVMKRLEIDLDNALKDLDMMEGQIPPLPPKVTEEQIQKAKDAIYEIYEQK